MFRFRAQRKDSSEWIIGWYHRHWFHEGQKFVHRISIDTQQRHDGFEINPHTLAISTGKLDSNGVEIFASFPIDGVMTEGGDVVSDRVSGVVSDVLFIDCAFRLLSKDRLHIDLIENYHFTSLTIIGKQGGGNEIRQN